jgi:glycosyltransferase involved in cell wall biosynthesis
MRLALKVARARGFDTIQGCNPPDLIFLVALPFKLFGKRYIFDHHDINPELYEAKFNKRGFFWKLMVLFERLNFRTADVVISTNESYREIAMTRGGKASEDVFVVRSGPDLTRLTRMEPDPKWRRGRQHLVGYVGVMGDQEGLDLLLEAARELVFERGHDTQFVLVGGGPALDDLKIMARDLGLEDHVTFTGRAPDDVLFSVLSSSDVCVNPDRVNPMNDQVHDEQDPRIHGLREAHRAVRRDRGAVFGARRLALRGRERHVGHGGPDRGVAGRPGAARRDGPLRPRARRDGAELGSPGR